MFRQLLGSGLVYESGDNRKPVIFLFPGTCCLYSSFNHILDGLHSYFYTVAVSYDGFDGKELQRIISEFSVQQEVSLVEGMKELMPIYHVIGKIPTVRNISNKIIVMEKHG